MSRPSPHVPMSAIGQVIDGGVLIMAGGTGGHVFPGLAVARALLSERIPVTWLGTRRGIEARLVPAAGLDIRMEWLAIRGLRRKGVVRWLFAPFTLGYAMAQSFRILRRCRPDVVLSMGGFVAGPGGIVAWLLRLPLVIHEQNAIPGLTNRWLVLFAERALCGFPGTFSAVPSARHVGNPVRPEIEHLPPPEERLVDRRGRLRLLIIGGSQGARVFNELLPQALQQIDAARRPEVRHQCGRDARDATRSAYGAIANEVVVSEFIDDMAQVYAWADLVVCRAGAMTIAELAASGSAAILVPYPHAVDDHQTANARYLTDRRAAVLLPQSEMTAARVVELLEGFIDNRELLVKMAQAARSLAMRDAAATVAQVCREVAA